MPQVGLLCRETRAPLRYCAPILATCLAMLSRSANGEAVEGFTEPYQTIRVASAETGILVNVRVAEGAQVQEGQELAELDSDVYRSLLTIAEVSMEARGRLDSAQAELTMRQHRLKMLQALQARGHANPEEVQRAQTDVAIAEGTLTAVKEDLQAKKLEYDRISQQLQRRVVRSPLQGVVTKLYRRKGEYVSPTDPVVAEIVQLDPLIATFMVTRQQADRLQKEQKLRVSLVDSRQEVVGVLEFVSPTIDAESGTVRIKLRLENRDGKLHSGERCLVDF